MPREYKAPQAFEEGEPLNIPLTPVASNQVKAVGYDPVTQTLAVQFNYGKALYQYPNVTPEQHAAFVGAESIGKHFGAHIQGLPFKKYMAPAEDGPQSAVAAAADGLTQTAVEA